MVFTQVEQVDEQVTGTGETRASIPGSNKHQETTETTPQTDDGTAGSSHLEVFG